MSVRFAWRFESSSSPLLVLLPPLWLYVFPIQYEYNSFELKTNISTVNRLHRSEEIIVIVAHSMEANFVHSLASKNRKR